MCLMSRFDIRRAIGGPRGSSAEFRGMQAYPGAG
jgi:hypothetical protein